MSVGDDERIVDVGVDVDAVEGRGRYGAGIVRSGDQRRSKSIGGSGVSAEPMRPTQKFETLRERNIEYK